MQNNSLEPTHQSVKLNQDNSQFTADSDNTELNTAHELVHDSFVVEPVLDFKEPIAIENIPFKDSIVDNVPEVIQRKKSDTSHITAEKRPLSNQNIRIIKKTKQPQKKVSILFKIETTLINFFSEIIFFIQKSVDTIDSWIEEFVNEYFDTKYYFTYLMCYATFLICALVVIIFKPF